MGRKKLEHDVINRRRRAEALLSDEMLQEALSVLGEDCYTQWLSSSPEDVPRRERLYLTVRLLDSLKAHLQSLILEGRLAEHRLGEMP